MRRSPIVPALLGASLLANALLVVLLIRREEPAPAGPSRAAAYTDSATRAKEADSLRDQLAAEKKKSEDLRLRVESLEADRKAAAIPLPAAPAKSGKIAAFREKLRKLMKIMKDPAAKAGVIDPETTVELTDTMMEFMKMSAVRTKEPGTYADYLRAFYEMALEGEGTALSGDQSTTLGEVFQGLGQDLARVPASPAGERLLKEIELEGEAMKRVFDLLTEPQRELISKDNMNVLAAGNLFSTSYVSKQGAADQILRNWKQAYQLEDAQLPQAKAAAQGFVDAMNRIDAERKDASSPFIRQGSPESYDYRLRSVREQLSALNLLQGSMTPAQQERLRNQPMREFVLFDPAQVVTPPAEK